MLNEASRVSVVLIAVFLGLGHKHLESIEKSAEPLLLVQSQRDDFSRLHLVLRTALDVCNL